MDKELREQIESAAKLLFKMLEGYEFKDKPNIVPTHGSCCTCQYCGYDHDGCICSKRDTFESCKKLAKWHLQRTLEARMDEHFQRCYSGCDEETSDRCLRYENLQSQLQTLEAEHGQ